MTKTDPPGEGFARRWARLKTGAAPASVPAPAPAVAEPEVVPPPAESVPLDEIATWLRQAVPQAWRQTVLRRLWLADPAIRGFIGPADYAWDWNTPGGAPGYGPMRALDDVAALLGRVMDGASRPAEPAQGEPPAAAGVAPVAPPPPLVVAVVQDEQPPPRRPRGGATPV